MSAWYLYFLFLKIGLFTFGGGYAMIQLFQDELVTRHKFISPEDFANMVALAQVTPGPVGLNAATYVGYRQLGFTGALAGTLGVITPSLILVTLAAVFFLTFQKNRYIQGVMTGIRPATLGLICAAVIFFAESSVFRGELSVLWKGMADQFGISWQSLVIFAGVLFTQWKWKPGIVTTLLVSGIAGGLLYLIP